MLDGRGASFACSTVEAPDISAEDSRNWQWSADLAHHVLITPSQVEVRSGRNPVPRKFELNSVENRLEAFLTFLDGSRRAALPDVVSFLVEEFREIWAANPGDEGQIALAAFLFALCAAGQPDVSVLDDLTWRNNMASDIGIDAGLVSAGFNDATIERARGMQARAPLGLGLVPSLVLRHAAGRLFQEAHAILESVQFDLFGLASISTSPNYSLAAAYFTPVPIARLLAEWALCGWTALPSDLTIADFACGSGVFLTEGLRSLERIGFQGTIRLIGRDKSAQAIAMAKVAIRTVQRDMATMQISPDVRQADALEAEWPSADIVLMNPPFRSWEQMNALERNWVHTATNGVGRGRPDLSVGFIERAIRALKPSGVLATLLPAGVLASDGLARWRDTLLQRTTPTLIAVLGEHGLFQHALVNVGILALRNNPSAPLLRAKGPLYVAWSSAETGSASRAIRAIRRSMSFANVLLATGRSNPPGVTEVHRDADASWSITVSSPDLWKQRPSWLPGAGALGLLLETIQTTIRTKVSDLFHVRQGIRTGANDVFIQPAEVVERFTKPERRYFKKAVDTASFVDGEIKPLHYLFVPDRTWQTELEVSQAVPHFFSNYLKPNQTLLQKRKSLHADRWWDLTRVRKWTFEKGPRLVSKRFGLFPAFARDLEGRFAVVQANAWKPTDTLASGRDDDALRALLTAYWWLLNSRIAIALLREYCPNVAGGQLDLEHKYVKHVPLPNLVRQFQENPALQLLASSIRTRCEDRLPKISERDQFAATAFGTNLSEWNLSGLELPD
jgi:predicted RNA methylase